MRTLLLITSLLCIGLGLFLWRLPLVRELTAPGTSFISWFAPLGLAFLLTAAILFILRMAQHGGKHSSRH
jgi:hypothetical protein